MKVPNAEAAIIPPDKLREYCLNPEHPVGKHKARVFASALGIARDDAEELRDILLEAVQTTEAEYGACDTYGQRYNVACVVERLGHRAIVRSTWIIRPGEDVPSLLSCRVLPKSR